MKLQAVTLILALTLGTSLACAQGGGGGAGGGGGSAGGASGGAGSAAGSPSAGSAGAGSLGTNGVPSGPANAAGLNNSGNDPSGSGNAPNFRPGTTTGLANPSQAPLSSGAERNSSTPPRGTNSAGTAGAPGGGGGVRNHGPTSTSEQDSDARINAENRKLDRAVNSICRGC